MPKKENLGRCSECGSKVVFIAKPGRTYDIVAGFLQKIPDNFPIPTCEACGEESMTLRISVELFQILKRQLNIKLLRACEEISIKHNVTPLEIESVCGLERGELRRILTSSADAPSRALVELLLVFAYVPGAMEFSMPSLTTKR